MTSQLTRDEDHDPRPLRDANVMSDLLNTPLKVNATILSSTSAEVTWDGSPGITYNFSFWKFPFGDPISFDLVGTQFVMGGLETRTLYNVRITGGGRQGGTTLFPYEVVDPGDPERPPKVAYVNTNFASDTGPQNYIDLLWARSKGEGLAYRVSYYPQNDPNALIELKTEKNSTELTDLSLTGEGVYVITVQAFTPKGESEPVQVRTSTLRDKRPAQLSGLRILEKGRTSVTLTWLPSDRADEYEVSHDGMMRPISQSETTARFEGLAPATRYEFRVVPRSLAGIQGGGSFAEVFTDQ
jgi:hypothetical protein